MYNRCSLPRIVAKDTVEEATLGDSENMDDEARPEQEPTLPTMSKRSARLASLRDNENWGQVEVEADHELDLDILDDEDEEIIECLIDLLCSTTESGEATKNYERGLLSNCCNPYTISRLIDKGSEVRCGNGGVGYATMNYERGHLSNCCNPYTVSRMVDKGSEVKWGNGGGEDATKNYDCLTVVIPTQVADW